MGTDDVKLITEYFDDKFATVLETMEAIIDRKVQPISEDVTELKSDTKIVKAAVTDTNIQVQNHEQRLTALEAN